MLDHLAERDRPAVKRRLRRAWARDDHTRALDELRLLASELDRSYPGAAASLRVEAERQFRRIIGYRDRAKLVTAIEDELAPQPVSTPTSEEAITLLTA